MCSICNKNKCCCKPKTVVQYGSNSSRITKGIKGERGLPGPTKLTIANTVFVSKNGSDVTGLAERLDKPFLTISAAITATVAFFPARSEYIRPRIVVFSGVYVENIVLKKFIDFDLTDIVLDGGITDNQVDFGSSDADVFTNIIYGNAIIRNKQTSGVVTALLLWKANTKLLLYCDTLCSVDNDCCAFINTRKTRVYANRIFTESTGSNAKIAVEMAQGFSLAEYTESLVEIIGADIYNTVDSIAATVSFQVGAELKNQTLSLINCRVKNMNSAASDAHRSAITCGTVQASNGKLNLYNTTIYTTTEGNSIYVQSGNTLVVKYFHSNMANLPTGGLGTLTAALGSLTVDAAVTAEF